MSEKQEEKRNLRFELREAIDRYVEKEVREAKKEVYREEIGNLKNAESRTPIMQTNNLILYYKQKLKELEEEKWHLKTLKTKRKKTQNTKTYSKTYSKD